MFHLCLKFLMSETIQMNPQNLKNHLSLTFLKYLMFLMFDSILKNLQNLMNRLSLMFPKYH